MPLNWAQPRRVDAATRPFFCHLQMWFPLTPAGMHAVGSGCLIAPGLVLTCGHNLFDATKGGKVRRATATFGRGRPVRVHLVDTTAQWTEISGQPQDFLSPFDIGIAVLEQRIVGIEPLPVASVPDAALAAGVSVGGFPANPPAPWREGELFGATAIPLLSDGRMNYPIHTLAGMSGGAAYVFDSATGARTVCGVHNSFHNVNYEGTIVAMGGGVRITAGVLALIESWREMFA